MSPFSACLVTRALQQLAFISTSPTKPCEKSTIVHNRCVKPWTRDKPLAMNNWSNKKVEPKPSVLTFHERERFLLSMDSGPAHSRCGVTSFPECPGIGQCFPDRQREQFSFGGSSTVLRRRPYFLRGMVKHQPSRLYNVALKSNQFLRYQGISVTLRGTLSVLPLRPSSDLTDLTL